MEVDQETLFDIILVIKIMCCDEYKLILFK
jgi:hypothetical protein